MSAPLPEEWRTVPLRSLADIVRGVSFDRSDVMVDSSEDAVPILRAGNIGDELDTETNLVWVPASRVSKEQLLRQGDIAICMSSGSQAIVGKSASLHNEWRGAVGAFCAVIRPKPTVMPEFLAVYLQGPIFEVWRLRQAQGVAIKNLRRTELEVAELPLPPRSEQQRIVEILHSAKAMQRLHGEIERKTAEFIPALFFEMFGNPVENSRHWKVRLCGKLIVDSPQNGVYKPAESYGMGTPIVRIGDFYNGRLADFMQLQRLSLTNAEKDKYALSEGDILINRVNSIEFLGKSALVTGRSYAPCG